MERPAWTVLGSSPLARGTPGGCFGVVLGGGLIPARAGNTQRCLLGLPVAWAHPRSRGEHKPHVEFVTQRAGSSPLARGTRGVFFDRGCPLWLIPARAGNTTIRGPPLRPTGAHPRSRGEHSWSKTVMSNDPGSSPLARGTRSLWWDMLPGTGLIPARAGTTPQPLTRPNDSRAHPRSRGDHVPAVKFKLTEPGSSPLARGPQNGPGTSAHYVGLIPARAGTTPGMRWRSVRSRAHPRSRGDHTGTRYRVIATKGSSPLARGPRD